MKKRFFISLLLFLSMLAFGQKNNKLAFQFWDSTGKTVKNEKNASFFTTTQKVNDTCWQFQNYKMMGPMVSSEQYKEKEGKTPHGRSSFMRLDGSLDSTGFFVNGKPNGIWIYFNRNGMPIARKEYSMGELLSSWNAEETGASQKDTLANEPDVQAQFTGGSVAWQRYLIQNLRYPEYARGRKIMGNTKTYFQIDTEGRISDEIILKSVEFTLDNEALRLLRESPKWTPAMKNGEKVKSYKQQAIAFRTE